MEFQIIFLNLLNLIFVNYNYFFEYIIDKVSISWSKGNSQRLENDFFTQILIDID
jgi:hypothetical protein